MENHWKKVASGMTVVSKDAPGLWSQACEYFQWCDSNPVKHKVTIKSGKGAGAKVEEEMPRPYSIKGLCLHCGITEDYISSVRSGPKTDDYYIVIDKILYIIYLQLYEYGMTGVYNPIFTAKALNIESHEDTGGAVTVNIVQEGVPQLATSESEILENLEMEMSKNEIPKEQSEKFDM